MGKTKKTGMKIDTNYLRRKMAAKGIWTFAELARRAGLSPVTFKLMRYGYFWSEESARKIEKVLGIRRRSAWVKGRIDDA